jgi:Ca2+-binding EF-hand superfamily protein
MMIRKVLVLLCLVSVSVSHEMDFKKFDLNGDGWIDPQELRTELGDSLSEQDLHEFWLAVDRTSRGMFNLAEYVDYAVRQSDLSDS